MVPEPLHPAVVHVPIALAILLPAIALATWLAIRRAWLPARAWVPVVAFHLLLVASAWAALETGEQDEERVEPVVGERLIHEHEEAAEWFLWSAVAATLVSGLGLLGGTVGGVGRIATVAATLVVFGAGIRTGHLGGELVYRHGAARAHVEGVARPTAPAPPGETGAPLP